MEDKDLLEALRKEVTKLLPQVEGVMALRRIGDSIIPHLYRQGNNLSDLAMSPHAPLVNAVRRIQQKYPDVVLGVVVKGCDQRTLVELAKRQQIDLEGLKFIGVACTTEMARACHCSKPYPDEIAVGQKVEGSRDPRLEEFLDMSLGERLAFWQHAFSKCLKCYGCRDVCPECFCPECVLEDNLWVDIGLVPPPFPMFHLIRAMHTVAKCIGCGECERACPVDIPLTILYDLLHEDVERVFGYEAGASVEEAPLLDSKVFLADTKITRPRD